MKPLLQIEREANSVLDLGHGVRGKLAQLALQPWFDQCPDPLYVNNGGLVQKRELSHGHFIATAPWLGSQGGRT